MRKDLTQKTLKAILRYERKTGLFFWRKRADVDADWNTRYAGKKAGSSWGRKDKRARYIVIKIFGIRYTGHQLAWLYVTGKWPVSKIDHQDLDGENNRWKNLRPATNSQNAANRGSNSNNTTGFKGVTKTPSGKFRSTIRIGGERHHCGIFLTALQAHDAYYARALELFGNFARAR